MARDPGDPEDTEFDPPLPDENEPEDLQDDALVEDEADEESEPDQIDAKQPDQQRQDQQADRQPSRRDRRIEALTTSLAEERRQRESLNQRLDALLTARQTQSQPQESPEARAQRLALLTPEERIREEMQTDRQTFAREMYQMRLATADANDRAAFQAKAAVNSRYKRMEARVEAELATLRSQGQTIEREKLMAYLIGKDVLEKADSPEVKQQRAAAERRVQRQTTRPANSGSDVAPARDRRSSLERRLENIEL